VKSNEVKVLLKLVYYICAVTILETRYSTFSPLCCFPMFIAVTAVGVLCIVLLSCVYLCYLVCIILLRVYCCLTYVSCRIAG